MPWFLHFTIFTMLDGSPYTFMAWKTFLHLLSKFQEHGHLVIAKTPKRLSAMPMDQTHGEGNAVMVKGSGGAVGLTG